MDSKNPDQGGKKQQWEPCWRRSSAEDWVSKAAVFLVF